MRFFSSFYEIYVFKYLMFYRRRFDQKRERCDTVDVDAVKALCEGDNYNKEIKKEIKELQHIHGKTLTMFIWWSRFFWSD